MTRRILIVDDSGFQRTLIRGILEDDFEVVGEAENGSEAVTLFEETRPDLVTMDIMMPEVNGIEATGDIKERDPGARVVMCTSVEQRDKMKQAVKAGADGYVTKPVEEDALRSEVESALAS
ncbi:response regulator [Halobaculum gomorrense]|uniref:Two-component system, chemotaxis family, response regulator CheY n=1 Tax=Halobaculum gomorrense TaxID=43928 RepID=A0A1M5K6C7_9EURY|nr:response regulator [Halobaculum gomorrense]SHG48358.1 two-component system, chemotaxis family, response regulator CheY [Halobaculum gomorrense]